MSQRVIRSRRLVCTVCTSERVNRKKEVRKRASDFRRPAVHGRAARLEACRRSCESKTHTKVTRLS